MKHKKKVPLLVLLGAVITASYVGGASATSADSIKCLGNPKVAQNGGTYYSDYSSQEEVLKAGDALAEDVADEGMVLLKNDGQLPWEGVKNISVFGKNSVDPGYTGGGSGGAKGQRTPVSIYDALREKGYNCNPALETFYKDESRSGIARQTLQDIFAGPIDIGETAKECYDKALKSTFNSYNDAALVVITRVGSEGSDNGTAGVVDHELENGTASAGVNHYNSQAELEMTYNELSRNEKDMIEMVKGAGFKNIVIVVNTPSAIELGDLQSDPAINGIIWAGLPGYTGFRSLAGILEGSVNPSGGLADTFYADMRLDPTFQNFGSGNQHGAVLNADGTAKYTDHSAILDKDGKEVSATVKGGSAGGDPTKGASSGNSGFGGGGDQGGPGAGGGDQGGPGAGGGAPGGFGAQLKLSDKLNSNSSSKGGTKVMN